MSTCGFWSWFNLLFATIERHRVFLFSLVQSLSFCVFVCTTAVNLTPNVSSVCHLILRFFFRCCCCCERKTASVNFEMLLFNTYFIGTLKPLLLLHGVQHAHTTHTHALLYAEMYTIVVCGWSVQLPRVTLIHEQTEAGKRARIHTTAT